MMKRIMLSCIVLAFSARLSAGAGQETSLLISFATLPEVVYSDEQVNLTVELINSGENITKAFIRIRSLAYETVREVSGETSESVIIPLAPAIKGKPLPQRITVEAIDIAGNSRKSLTIEFRDAKSDLSDLRTNDMRLQDRQGNHVVLVTHRPEAAQRRKWAVPKAINLALKRPSRWLLSVPSNLVCANKLQISSVEMIPHFADPLQMLKHLPELTPSTPAILAIDPSFAAVFERRDAARIQRYLSALIERIQQRNTLCRIVLLTPPPVIGEEALTERYAQMIRDLVQIHGITTIDLHRRMRSQPDWESFYRLAPNVYGLYPTPEARRLIAKYVAEGLK